jgi:hypothetical protein
VLNWQKCDASQAECNKFLDCLSQAEDGSVASHKAEELDAGRPLRLRDMSNI